MIKHPTFFRRMVIFLRGAVFCWSAHAKFGDLTSMSEIKFFLNGSLHQVVPTRPEQSLNDYLQNTSCKSAPDLTIKVLSVHVAKAAVVAAWLHWRESHLMGKKRIVRSTAV